MSRTSLTRRKRDLALSSILSRCSRVWGVTSSFLKARAQIPMIVLMGVRISWLMMESREACFSRAASTWASVSVRVSALAIASRVSASMSVVPRMM